MFLLVQRKMGLSSHYVPLGAENGLSGTQASVVAVPGLLSTGSTVVAHRLSFSMARGILSGQGSNICTGRWILYH